MSEPISFYVGQLVKVWRACAIGKQDIPFGTLLRFVCLGTSEDNEIKFVFEVESLGAGERGNLDIGHKLFLPSGEEVLNYVLPTEDLYEASNLFTDASQVRVPMGAILERFGYRPARYSWENNLVIFQIKSVSRPEEKRKVGELVYLPTWEIRGYLESLSLITA